MRTESGDAIGLNGIDAFVEVPDSPAFSQGNSGRGLSAEAWIRPDQRSLLVGGLGEVAIHPRVLTAREIRDNFSAA